MTAPTERTTVKRLPARGVYDRETIDAILDEAYVCHVGVVVGDTPRVIPMLHARAGDHLLLHGSPASRTLRTAPGDEVCVTVTLVDGLVLARSGFHHSVNYRSVVIYGRPEVVPDDEKAAALDAIMESLVPGRLSSVRPMTEKEVRATRVLRLPISEASAKIRTGWPVDDEEDYDFPVWAGVIPIDTVYGAPETDPAMRFDIPPPPHATDYSRT